MGAIDCYKSDYRPPWSAWEDLSPTIGTDTTVITGLTNNVLYFFRIRPVAGTVEATVSRVVTAKPTGLRAIASYSQEGAVEPG